MKLKDIDLPPQKTITLTEGEAAIVASILRAYALIREDHARRIDHRYPAQQASEDATMAYQMESLIMRRIVGTEAQPTG